MVRLFIAIPLDAPTRSMFESVVLPSDNALRKTRSDELHVTLHFLGEVQNSLLAPLEHALRSIQCAPFVLDFKGAGSFGGRGRAEILWVGIEIHPQLKFLHSSIADCLRSLLLPKEDRSYSPHLTVARMKEPSSKATAEFTLANANLHCAMRVSEFCLYSSLQQSRGCRYQVLESFPLCE
jgi:2'-5' RNA ligase